MSSSGSDAVRVESVTVDYDVPIPMRDNVVLRGDVARPSGGRWPTILMRSPYGKDSEATEVIRNLSVLARKGFAVMWQDTRLRGSSGGEGQYQAFVPDREDGEDTVAWVAAQPWSNGEVFGYSQSYQGFTQWAAASKAPLALKAIAPGCAPGHPSHSMIYYGGALELSLTLGWWMMMGADMLQRRHADDPASLQVAMERYSRSFGDMASENFTQLPLAAYPPLVTAGVGDELLEIVKHERAQGLPVLDGLAAAQRYEEVVVPALIWCGWHDFFIRSSVAQYVGMRSRGGSEAARTGTRLILGPWIHDAALGQVIGERDFGMAASALAMPGGSLVDTMLGFFRDTAAGKPPLEKPVKLFVMGANVWRDESEWPLARTQITPWHLSSGGRANTAAGDGRFGPEFRASPPDSYVYDPARPVPVHGGGLLFGGGLAGPRDQRDIAARDDVLVYTSDALEHAIEVTGSTVVELWIETDVVDSDFVARLVDVAPDGVAYAVAEGVQRARWREDPLMETAGKKVTRGEPTLIRIELTPTSNLFLPGHRLRLDVTSSCFPRWQRNLNIWDQPTATLDEAVIANHRVLHDEAHRSRVLLPIIPAD